MEQVKGIEPSCSAWEADVLPLNYTCISEGLYYYNMGTHILQEGIFQSWLMKFGIINNLFT